MSVSCMACKGEGTTVRRRWLFFKKTEPCETCGGTGRWGNKPPEEQSVAVVRVPPRGRKEGGAEVEP